MFRYPEKTIFFTMLYERALVHTDITAENTETLLIEFNLSIKKYRPTFLEKMKLLLNIIRNRK